MNKRAMPWTRAQLPTLDDKVAIVTGANSGIGFEAARALAGAGAEVILACRSRTKAEAALAEIRSEYPQATISFSELDLSSLESVRSFAARFAEQHRRLDLLINNAGVMMPESRTETANGFELQFGVNHLGHFTLTCALVPLIAQTPGARVVTISSQAHRRGTIDFEDFNWERRPYRRMAAYGQSKLANLLFTFELQRRFEQSSIDAIAVAAHPGWTATDLQRHWKLAQFFNGLLAMKREQGALPTLRAATDPTAKGGDYFGPDGCYEMRGYPVRVRATRAAQNREVAERLWRLSEELCDIEFDPARG